VVTRLDKSRNLKLIMEKAGKMYCILFLYCTSWQNATYITYK